MDYLGNRYSDLRGISAGKKFRVSLKNKEYSNVAVPSVGEQMRTLEFRWLRTIYLMEKNEVVASGTCCMVRSR